MDDSLNICLACGYCCDGTLIGFVQLDPDEIPAVRKIKEIEEFDGSGFFLQPCDKFCDGCTVYADRPKRCGQYKCELLKSVENKELAFDSAVEIIKEVKVIKDKIEIQLSSLTFELKSHSFYFKMVELKKILTNENTEKSFVETHSELILNLNNLDGLLSEKFGASYFK